ncbi:Cyclic AMP-dependent transcription factor ATF-7, partial [Dryobates pubescens]
GALDMSLPSTPDIKIKEEEPVEVDSSPPDSPASHPRSPQPQEKVGLQVCPSRRLVEPPPTGPTAVSPGLSPASSGANPPPPPCLTAGAQSISWELPLPLQPSGRASPQSPLQPSEQVSEVPPGAGGGDPAGAGRGGGRGGGAGAELLLPAPAEQMGWRGPLTSFCLLPQRLKASLTASSSLNGSNLVLGSASTMVPARPEQSQILVQHPDAPSPAQPQVCFTHQAWSPRALSLCSSQSCSRPQVGSDAHSGGSAGVQPPPVFVFPPQNEVTLLRNEVAQLKQLLLAHKDCPVTALQKKTQGYLGE